MTVDKAYNSWAEQYDTDENKTRDLEKLAAQSILSNYQYQHVIELGCGTGKNTEWLAENAMSLIGLDFSAKMLKKAKEKINLNTVEFKLADLSQPWNVENNSADLISCSLVLEHIKDLNFIFCEASKKLKNKGIFYLCELHPFKQYLGSKARFKNADGITELEVFVHHVSDYTNAATANGFKVQELQEWFDQGNLAEVPRLLSFVFVLERE